jgi:hypothetical protein
MKRLLAAALGFIALSASAQDCTLILPPRPLTAQGLATPFQLTATDPATPCHELDPTQSAFVQAAIIDPDTGRISLYTPVVIDAGTAPARPPVVPVLPAEAVVALWFGYNGANLTLQRHGKLHLGGRDEDLAEGRCVNGLGSSVFGQFSYCNAPHFFATAHAAIRSGKLDVPPLGTGLDGLPCPTTRSFAEIDQDPSDNLPVSYLKINGQVAQFNAANAAIAGAVKFGNPSDERLVPILLDPPLGCHPWTAPDLTNGGTAAPALALNELMAAARQAPPIALIPPQDPMVLVNGKINFEKLALYRHGVDQSGLTEQDPVAYCQHFRAIHPHKLELDRQFFAARPSPFPNMANSLFTFMAQRYVQSYSILGCDVLLKQPVNESLTVDGHGVVIDAVYTP